MKKTIAITMALFLVSMFAVTLAPAAAHTEADPFVTDLIAGQHTDVGDVLVWNDGDTLFVKYETTGDWEIGETHLAVATTLGGIPHTKNGNPIPGNFEFSEDHDPFVTDFTYEVDLGSWSEGTLLYIAAHAGVCESGSSSIIPAQGVISTVTLYAWATAFNVGNVTVAVTGTDLVVTFNSAPGWVLLGTDLFIDLAPPPGIPDYTTFPYHHPGLGGVTTNAFTIPLASLPINTPIYISAHASMRYVPFGTLWDAWADENPFDGWTKYFSVTIPGVPVPPVCETAWGKGTRFVDTTWAMYFTYTVQ